VALQLHLGLALGAEAAWGTPFLLPWEQHALAWATELSFMVGLQVVSFLGFVVTAWGALSLPSPAPRAGRAGRRVLAACVVLGLVSASLAWWWRERDPRHVAAHLELGQRFLARGMLLEAEDQFRRAASWGDPTSPAERARRGVTPVR
jgi:hypothetical protein